jgi:uncharacterized protein (DUF2344 family)
MNAAADAPRQRWQILFSRTDPALALREREVLAEFERVFGEAGLPIAQTQATKPKLRLRLAANVPQHMELRGDVLEVWFDELVPLDSVLAAGQALTDGVAIVDAREVWHGFPSAASQVRGGEYEVEANIPRELTADEVREAVVKLLATESLPGMRRRGESERKVDSTDRDLRPYIEDLEMVGFDEKQRTVRLRMQLRLDPSGAGRPVDVVDALALGLTPTRTIRQRLLFVDTPPIAR